MKRKLSCLVSMERNGVFHGFLRSIWFLRHFDMRLILATVICLIALYAADSYWFGGLYFYAVRGIAMQIRHFF